MGTCYANDRAKAPKRTLFPAMVTWGLAAATVTSILLWLRLASALRAYPWHIAFVLSGVSCLAIYFLVESVRRRGQISLIMMLALLTLVAILSSTWGKQLLRTRQQRRQLSAIQAAGGAVDLAVVEDDNEYELVRNTMGGKVVSMEDWRIPDQVVAGDKWLLPQWLGNVLGNDALKHPTGVRFSAAGTTDAQLSTIDFTGFRSIDFTATVVSDAGLKHLAQYPEWRFVAARNTSITDAGMRSIGQFQELRFLDLTGTKVTDVGLLELYSLEKLQMVYLWRTKVTKRGVRELHKVRPLCMIGHDSVSYTNRAIQFLE